MENFTFLPGALLLTVAGSAFMGGLSAGVQNKVQGDDVLKSLRGGLVGGIATGLAGWWASFFFAGIGGR
jgi:hypothetical protein